MPAADEADPLLLRADPDPADHHAAPGISQVGRLRGGGTDSPPVPRVEGVRDVQGMVAAVHGILPGRQVPTAEARIAGCRCAPEGARPAAPQPDDHHRLPVPRGFHLPVARPRPHVGHGDGPVDVEPVRPARRVLPVGDLLEPGQEIRGDETPDLGEVRCAEGVQLAVVGAGHDHAPAVVRGARVCGPVGLEGPPPVPGVAEVRGGRAHRDGVGVKDVAQLPDVTAGILFGVERRLSADVAHHGVPPLRVAHPEIPGGQGLRNKGDQGASLQGQDLPLAGRPCLKGRPRVGLDGADGFVRQDRVFPQRAPPEGVRLRGLKRGREQVVVLHGPRRGHRRRAEGVGGVLDRGHGRSQGRLELAGVRRDEGVAGQLERPGVVGVGEAEFARAAAGTRRRRRGAGVGREGADVEGLRVPPPGVKRVLRPPEVGHPVERVPEMRGHPVAEADHEDPVPRVA
ncbi:MAG: hypothetical protein A4E67_00276 [Syntrophaceae bacterium PtaB.Bin038]|nr:MAG: hypothetical protein A4E67_00276 [Syntrophaceae bacterium PtaB.Bin038]